MNSQVRGGAVKIVSEQSVDRQISGGAEKKLVDSQVRGGAVKIVSGQSGKRWDSKDSK